MGGRGAPIRVRSVSNAAWPASGASGGIDSEEHGRPVTHVDQRRQMLDRFVQPAQLREHDSRNRNE